MLKNVFLRLSHPTQVSCVNFKAWITRPLLVLMYGSSSIDNSMDFESPDVEREFPGLYGSESSRRSDSDCEHLVNLCHVVVLMCYTYVDLCMYMSMYMYFFFR